MLRGASPRLPQTGALGYAPKRCLLKESYTKNIKKKNHGKLIASLRRLSSDVAILDFFQSKRGSGNQSLMGGIEGGSGCL